MHVNTDKCRMSKLITVPIDTIPGLRKTPCAIRTADGRHGIYLGPSTVREVRQVVTLFAKEDGWRQFACTQPGIEPLELVLHDPADPHVSYLGMVTGEAALVELGHDARGAFSRPRDRAAAVGLCGAIHSASRTGWRLKVRGGFVRPQSFALDSFRHGLRVMAALPPRDFADTSAEVQLLSPAWEVVEARPIGDMEWRNIVPQALETTRSLQ